MALNKQPITINFAQGLDTKTDQFQVQPGKFLSLQNTIFTKGGLLQKRNGYKNLPDLPDTTFTTLTTFNGDLTAIGTSLNALSVGYNKWVDRGKVQPLELSILPLIRNNLNQSQSDTAISPTGLICTVYTTQDPANLLNPVHMYVVADVITGQNIIEPTQIETLGLVLGQGPRVFVLANFFVVVFVGRVGISYQLKFFRISTINPNNVTPIVNIFDIRHLAGDIHAFDGVVFENHNALYLAWATAAGLAMTFITANFVIAGVTIVDAAPLETIAISVVVDEPKTNPPDIVWVSYIARNPSAGFALAVNHMLVPIMAKTAILTAVPALNITSNPTDDVLTVVYEVDASYNYGTQPVPPAPPLPLFPAKPTHFLRSRTVTFPAVINTPGATGPDKILILSLGLASKAFKMEGAVYVLAVYQSDYQSTYFLVNTLGDTAVNKISDMVAILAYGNAKGYITNGLPSVNVSGNEASISYLLKLSVQSVNKNTNVPSGEQVAGVYSQTGINLVKFVFKTSDIITAEIGNNLHITGGITWAYDGYSSVEQLFFLYPDNVMVEVSATAGTMTAGTYFYRVTYEWTDNQGNAFRSAPSIPVPANGLAVAALGAVDVHIPMLRLTYKIANPVKIVIYRSSIEQPSYYQVTSITTPILNDVTLNQVLYTDTLPDSAILGNNLLYTTGGVLENIGPPSFKSIFLFDDRLWGITSEDRFLLWFSKQVLQATPVEFTDLQTIYVAPNIGAQGSTGALECAAAMDDKLCLFKASAINYINGVGPDATGANNQYSQPTFVTATVGCSNQQSIVFQPQGLMFEFANKAGNQIWLLSRDLQTVFVGAPVEKYTLNDRVASSLNIPGTNQVRFTMESGLTLMYDYFYGQWGTFVSIPAISSTLYQGVHAYLNKFGQVFQETPGAYLDGSSPVLVSLTTSWLNLAGLKGYQRAYRFYLLGSYFSPHKLNLQIAYDYNPNSLQYTQITPENFAPNYGIDTPYGQGTPYGGPGNLEQWRVFLTNQRCESFQITISEQYDPRFETPAGAGLTLSGITCILGIKGPAIPMRADRSVG